MDVVILYLFPIMLLLFKKSKIEKNPWMVQVKSWHCNKVLTVRTNSGISLSLNLFIIQSEWNHFVFERALLEYIDKCHDQTTRSTVFFQR